MCPRRLGVPNYVVVCRCFDEGDLRKVLEAARTLWRLREMDGAYPSKLPARANVVPSTDLNTSPSPLRPKTVAKCSRQRLLCVVTNAGAESPRSTNGRWVVRPPRCDFRRRRGHHHRRPCEAH